MHEVKEEWEELLEDAAYEVIAPAIQAGLNNMYKWYRKVTEDTPVYFICHGLGFASFLLEQVLTYVFSVLDPRRHLSFLEAAWEQSLLEKGLTMMRKVVCYFHPSLSTSCSYVFSFLCTRAK
jgi:hypothetical protein